MGYKGIIIGASGLVGSKTLDVLLNDAHYDEVLILVRKELPVKHKKLAQLIINFDEMQKYAQSITGHAVFCCMGTTKAKTPDKDQYYKIDHDYPLQVAQLAKANGVKHFHLVSAIGADAKSSTFYLRTKGEVERDVEKVGLDTLHIYQPSMLYGGREEKRTAEKLLIALFNVVNPLLVGGLRKYRSIDAHRVAKAMVKRSLTTDKGTFIHTYDNII